MCSRQLLEPASQSTAAALQCCCTGVQRSYTFGQRSYPVNQLAGTFSQHKQIILQLQRTVIQLGSAVCNLGCPVSGIAEPAGDFRYFIKHGRRISLGNFGRHLCFDIFNRSSADLSGQEVIAFIRFINDLGRLRICIQQGCCICREILRYNNRHVVSIIVQSGFCLCTGYKIPVEPVGLLKLLHQITAGGKLSALVISAFVFINNSNRQLGHFTVRVPECLKEQSAVHHGNEQDDEHGD
ncbi:hypothetical protein D3C75_372400 [compost metagenome]